MMQGYCGIRDPVELPAVHGRILRVFAVQPAQLSRQRDTSGRLSPAAVLRLQQQNRSRPLRLIVDPQPISIESLPVELPGPGSSRIGLHLRPSRGWNTMQCPRRPSSTRLLHQREMLGKRHLVDSHQTSCYYSNQ